MEVMVESNGAEKCDHSLSELFKVNNTHQVIETITFLAQNDGGYVH